MSPSKSSPAVLKQLFSPRSCALVAFGCALVAAILWWMPVVSGVVRAGLVGSVFLTSVAALATLRQSRKLIATCAALTLAIIVAAILTQDRPVQRQLLRDQMIVELRDHLEVGYLWGGENRRGIDCSGLPRNALRGAAIKRAVLDLNGGLAAMAIDHWWHDSSAKAIGEGYRDNSLLILEADNIISADHAKLLPGDIAITENGVHAVSYLGAHQWIHASPDAGKVVEVNASDTDDGWFKVPVKIVRWSVLDES